VRANQLLERGYVAEHRVELAVAQDVRHVREAVGATEVPQGVRVVRERVVADDAFVGDVVFAARADCDRPRALRCDEDEADVRDRGEPVDEAGEGRLELLARQPLLAARDVHEPEAA